MRGARKNDHHDEVGVSEWLGRGGSVISDGLWAHCTCAPSSSRFYGVRRRDCLYFRSWPTRLRTPGIVFGARGAGHRDWRAFHSASMIDHPWPPTPIPVGSNAHRPISFESHVNRQFLGPGAPSPQSPLTPHCLISIGPLAS